MASLPMGDNKSDLGESSSKRRLSLGGDESGSPDKRNRGRRDQANVLTMLARGGMHLLPDVPPVAPKAEAGSDVEMRESQQTPLSEESRLQRPSTASTSSHSPSSKFERSESEASSRATHPSRPVIAANAPRHGNPTWRMAESHRQASAEASTSPSSRSTTRHHPYHPSAPSSSRITSPPPSFNLSSGQPLVNPPLKTQAAFVGKLYAMLEDEEIAKSNLIHWSADGSIFTCPNPTELAK